MDSRHCKKDAIELFELLINQKKGTMYELFGKQVKKPDGNAGTQRLFNPVRYIHSWARNRLGKTICNAMLYCYVNYSLLKKIGIVL